TTLFRSAVGDLAAAEAAVEHLVFREVLGKRLPHADGGGADEQDRLLGRRVGTIGCLEGLDFLFPTQAAGLFRGNKLGRRTNQESYDHRAERVFCDHYWVTPGPFHLRMYGMEMHRLLFPGSVFTSQFDYVYIRVARPTLQHMNRCLVQVQSLDPLEVGDYDAGRAVDSHIAVDVNHVALTQQFVQNFDAFGQLTAKIAGIEILDLNPPNLDARFTIVGHQAMPIHAPIGHVVVGLHVEHGGDAEVLLEPVDVLGALREGSDAQVG